MTHKTYIDPTLKTSGGSRLRKAPAVWMSIRTQIYNYKVDNRGKTMNLIAKYRYWKFIFRDVTFIIVLIATSCSSAKADPLSLWNDTENKKAISKFVETVVNVNVPKSARLATFDFDGTMSIERPTYTEVIVSANRMCDLTNNDPDLKKIPFYQASCEQNWELIREKYTDNILLTAFLNEDLTKYEDYAVNFLKTKRDPHFKRTYGCLLYAPVRQLIQYLLDNDFTVYIVSGSQADFIRAMVESSALSLDSSKIIGTTIKLIYKQTENNLAEFVRTNSYIEPKAYGSGKAELIVSEIGKTPIFAVGNTMGDYPMLLTSTNGSLINQANGIKIKGFSMIINHDDINREYQYRDQELMDNANKYNWPIISMKHDFKVIFEDLRPECVN